MKIKVAEATGPVLDWMVAKAEGHETTIDGYGCIIRRNNVIDRFEPSTDWGWGGPIIEREEIGIRRNAPCSKGCEWQGSPSITAKGAGGKWGYGPTPLIAAMRCFVASKLGEEVDVPEELL